MPSSVSKVRVKGAPGLPGAGRPVGSLSRKTLMLRAAAEGALKKGRTPLDIMLKNMYFYDDKAEDLLQQVLNKMDNTKAKPSELLEMLSELSSFRMSAQKCASEAAGYVHPKLSSQTVDLTTRTIKAKPEGEMTDDELSDYYNKLRLRPTSATPLVIEHDANEMVHDE
jgi:hypothetical protein